MRRDEREREGQRGKEKRKEALRLNLEDEQPGRADRKWEGKPCCKVKGRSSSKREWLSGGKLLRVNKMRTERVL